jgi:hypothetical protein
MNADPNERRLWPLEEVEEIVWDNMKERVGIVAEDGRAELQ